MVFQAGAPAGPRTLLKMPHRYKSARAKWLATLALIVPCLLITIPVVVGYYSQRELKAAHELVDHTLEVQRQIDRVVICLLDAESGGRGYVASRRSIYLDSYEEAQRELPTQLETLRKLARNPVAQEHLRRVAQLIDEKLDFMDRVIKLCQEKEDEEMMALINTDAGKTIMDEIRGAFGALEKEEARLLVLRQEKLAQQSRNHTWVFVALVVLNVLFAGSVVILFRRLQKLRDLITVCAWSKTVKFEDEWVTFEQYLERRFNIDATHGMCPAEFEKALAQAIPREG